MKTLSAEPLNNKELIFLEETLIKYGNDDSILSVSELDGFLTNIISGPNTIQPSQWLPIIWGGHSNEPEWETTPLTTCKSILILLIMQLYIFTNTG